MTHSRIEVRQIYLVLLAEIYFVAQHRANQRRRTARSGVTDTIRKGELLRMKGTKETLCSFVSGDLCGGSKHSANQRERTLRRGVTQIP